MQYTVNNQMLSYTCEGPIEVGPDRVLLKPSQDLTVGKSWSGRGYSIEQLFSSDTWERFRHEVQSLILGCWRKSGLEVFENFPLEKYHTLIRNYEDHIAAVNETKLISTEKFPLGISLIEERISEIIGTELRALNPYDNQSVFHFRVIRPGSTDNNPLHRDVWLEDYESCINLYIPVAGSNPQSSLIICPGSHYWPESKIERSKAGAKINGVKFNVPAVTSINGDYSFVRPDPKENEVLVFSPYLIHGGAVNLNEDITRISIELRLWKK